MNPLSIETVNERNGYKIQKITGFTPFELDRLNRMPYQDMKQTLLKMLNERNGGLGNMMHRECGVYQMWVAADGMYVEIGG